jgi:hypothetical protein
MKKDMYLEKGMKKIKCIERQCKHFQHIGDELETDDSLRFCYCKAFPYGIPTEIAYGNIKHTKPYTIFGGDNGIQFEK